VVRKSLARRFRTVLVTGADENNFIEHKHFAVSHAALSHTRPMVRVPQEFKRMEDGQGFCDPGTRRPAPLLSSRCSASVMAPLGSSTNRAGILLQDSANPVQSPGTSSRTGNPSTQFWMVEIPPLAVRTPEEMRFRNRHILYARMDADFARTCSLAR
jgi:hypothetical protein